MARTRLDTQLNDITTDTIRLGTLVETALEQALQAIKTGDQALCGLIIASDITIDDTRSIVERKAFQSLILQQPLAGRDLRFLSSIPSIAGDLERMGDNADGIAQLLIRMAPLRTEGLSSLQIVSPDNTNEGETQIPTAIVTEASIMVSLLDLGQEARRMIHATMHAFAARDAQGARTIWQEDDVVDVRYHMVRHDLMTMLTGIHAIPALQQDELIMQRMTYWLWIAHNLERIGDHCTNICERIVFFLEGDSTITSTEKDE